MTALNPLLDQSSFDPEYQLKDLGSKIVVLLERIAESFKVALWEEGKQGQLSPLQIQIIVFIFHHPGKLCTVSYLAQEFNVSKPTVSEAVRIMEHKRILIRHPNALDGRRHTLALTASGHAVAIKAQHFATSILTEVNTLPSQNKLDLFQNLLTLLHNLQKAGLLSENRMCLNCPHLRIGHSAQSEYTCMLLGRPLFSPDLRVDCPDFKK